MFHACTKYQLRCFKHARTRSIRHKNCLTKCSVLLFIGIEYSKYRFFLMSYIEFITNGKILSNSINNRKINEKTSTVQKILSFSNNIFFKILKIMDIHF